MIPTDSSDGFSKYGSFKDNMEFESRIRIDDNTLVYVMLLVYYPGLSKKELKVCGTITSTMWDFHWDVALYDQVLACELPREYYICREELPPEFLGDEKPCLFTNEKEVQEVITCLVAKGIFHDKKIEFQYGSGDNQTTKTERVLTFTQKELYDQINTLRVKLGVYY